MMENKVKSINWHITSRCNYSCRFCFARDLGHGSVDLRKARAILQSVKLQGVEKVNFAGGEPLLHPDLIDLLELSHDMGFTTSVVTNGSLVDADFLERVKGVIDWLGISVDTPDEAVERAMGRGEGNHVSKVVEVCSQARSLGIPLKVNTVVTGLNHQADLRGLIAALDPQRWKVFQCLHIRGQNDEHIESLSVSEEEFEAFKQRHSRVRLSNGTSPVFETAEDMVDSYLMLGPEGDLIINRGNEYKRIPLSLVKDSELSDIIDRGKYYRRGGDYAWNNSTSRS